MTRRATALLVCMAIAGCGMGSRGRPGGQAVRDVDWFQYSAGGRVAAIATVDGEPYTLEVGRSTTAMAAVAQGRWVLSASWLPDRDKLVVATTPVHQPDVPSRVEVVSSDGGHRERLVLSTSLIIDGGIASTSDELAVVSARTDASGLNDLWSVNLRTGAVHRLTSTDSETEDSPVALGATSVAYVRGQTVSASTAPNGSIWVMSLVTGASTALSTTGLVVADLGVGLRPGTLTFSAFPADDRSKRAIWLVDTTTSELRRCPVAGSHPVARPNSAMISFVEPRHFSIEDVAATDCVHV